MSQISITSLTHRTNVPNDSSTIAPLKSKAYRWTITRIASFDLAKMRPKNTYASVDAVSMEGSYIQCDFGHVPTKTTTISVFLKWENWPNVRLWASGDAKPSAWPTCWASKCTLAFLSTPSTNLKRKADDLSTFKPKSAKHKEKP